MVVRIKRLTICSNLRTVAGMVNYYISFTVIITLSTKFLFEVQLKYPSPPPRFYLLERMSRERGERREREKQTP